MNKPPQINQLSLDFDQPVAEQVMPTPAIRSASSLAVTTISVAAPSAAAAQHAFAAFGPNLDARRAVFRADLTLVEAWISAKCEAQDSLTSISDSHTARSYRREGRRFLLWLHVARQTSLLEASLADCLAYRSFLANPSPREQWCAPRRTRRTTAGWRPFEGPLSPTARRQALSILRSMYRFMQDQRLAIGNPWNGVSVPRNSQPRIETARHLTGLQWRAVEQQLEDQPEAPDLRQLAWAARLLYATGLRLAEIIAIRCFDFRFIEFDDPPTGFSRDESGPVAGAWFVLVHGKGMKDREVPVPSQLIQDLGDLLMSRGLPRDPREAGPAPLLVAGKHLHVGGAAAAGLSNQGLYRQLKRLFAAVAARLLHAGRPADAEVLARASTHWLRHTYGTHALAAGTALDVVQRNLGHASLSTTTIYTSPELRRRATESLKLGFRGWS